MKRKKNHWIKAVLYQCLFMSLAAIACIFAPFLFERGASAIEAAAQLAILPLCGGVSAYFAVRKGLNNYAAIVAPPVLVPLTYLLVVGTLPSHLGGIMLTGFISIVGAAAAEVVAMREGKGKRR